MRYIYVYIYILSDSDLLELLKFFNFSEPQSLACKIDPPFFFSNRITHLRHLAHSRYSFSAPSSFLPMLCPQKETPRPPFLDAQSSPPAL